MTPNPLPAPTEPRPELEEKIRAQGVAQTATFDHLLGAGRDLWVDDEEFEQFLVAVEAVRTEKG